MKPFSYERFGDFPEDGAGVKMTAVDEEAGVVVDLWTVPDDLTRMIRMDVSRIGGAFANRYFFDVTGKLTQKVQIVCPVPKNSPQSSDA